ncbi:unnamed protein product [marine sediment metagenome]|uniref:Uncharacterized protein n=1 Tax=marine sediment metagenome TaxID=412755 RepID=X1BS68_9ZZZZ
MDPRFFSLIITIDHHAGNADTPYLREKVRRELLRLPEVEGHLESGQNQHRFNNFSLSFSLFSSNSTY